MAKSKETPTQRRQRLAETAGRQFGVFMRRALRLADECNIDPRKVFGIFARGGVPGEFIENWREAEGDYLAHDAEIPDVDWEELIKQLGPMIAEILEQSAKAK